MTARCACATALLALMAVPAPASGQTAEQQLADRYAPIVALKDREGECGVETVTGESWRPTTVKIVLGNRGGRDGAAGRWQSAHVAALGGNRPIVSGSSSFRAWPSPYFAVAANLLADGSATPSTHAAGRFVTSQRRRVGRRARPQPEAA